MKRIFLSSLLMPLVIFAGYRCSKNPGIDTSGPGTYHPDPSPPDTSTYRDTSGKTYLALGDSYTIGQSVDPTARFPNQTAEWLRDKKVVMSQPMFIAQTGWTTKNLMGAIEKAKLTQSFDIVSLLIGVNDQYQGADTSEYRKGFTALLLKSIALARNKSARVFVVSIPDYSATPFVNRAFKEKVSEEIDLFNDINKEITLEYGCIYLDITPSTRYAANDASLLAYDNLHYSEIEYKKWADQLGPLMLNALK